MHFVLTWSSEPVRHFNDLLFHLNKPPNIQFMQLNFLVHTTFMPAHVEDYINIILL